MIELRDYQRATVDSVLDQFRAGIHRSAVVLPTGSGKTVIFAHLADRWAAERGRVVILVDRDELIGQTLEKLRAVAPDGPEPAVIKAERNDLRGWITVASVQTLMRPGRLAAFLIEDQWVKVDNRPDMLVIVDECDLATAPGYRRVMAGLGCYDEISPPTAYALGVTATLARADRASLGTVWESVAARMDILDMIPQWLVDVTGRMITVDGMSLADARVSGGDFTSASLTEILTSTDAAAIAANGWVEHAGDRPGLVFVPTLAAADYFLDAFRAAGFQAEKVYGTQPKDERRKIVSDFRNGGPDAPQVLINCMALTRGFDAPRAEVCMIARPTMHAVLYQQMIGRVLRQFPGKDSALVLDLVGASRDHRLASLVDLSSRRIMEVRQGESLVQAAIREREDRNPYLADYVIDSTEIQLFGMSRARWLQTRLGVWFLPVGKAMIFLWPDVSSDTYRVGIRDLSGRSAGGRWLGDGMDLSWAMAWAEQEARKINDEGSSQRGGADLISSSAQWRGKRPRERMINFAESLGVSTAGNAGQVSDRISIEQASRALDAGILGRR